MQSLPQLMQVGRGFKEDVTSAPNTTLTLRTRDEETARALQQLCMSRSFRVYTNPDVVGCEIAGALKNVIALAAGIAQALADSAGVAADEVESPAVRSAAVIALGAIEPGITTS